MKKINLFNKTISPLSDGKGCPVERGEVWELPRRTPCATPSWKEGERKVPSFRGNAESPRCCRELVCGKTDGIPLFSGMTVRICGMMIVIAALFATPSFAEPTELDKKTVASKAYVDTKQNIIDTDLVEFYDAPGGVTHNVPSLVSYGTGTNNTDGLLGNKIGIISFDVFSDPLSSYSYNEMDNYVPTVRAVASEFQYIWDSMPNWAPLTWNNTQSTAINAYNSTFGNGTNNWAGSSEDLINGQFLANSLALKQNKIPAGTAGNVVTYSGTAGTVGSVATANAPTYNETTGVLENGTNIATIAAVDTRQKKMTCAGWDSDTHTDEHCWLWSIE